MQIHELNSFTGSPGAGDYFVIDDGSETTKISAEDFGSTFASVIDAYPITGATPLTAGWLSATNGGAALTPEENRIYILMAASGTYAANTMFRWNSAAYEPLISGGGSVLDYYPIGSYYETSDTAFDPNVAWGGTWSLEAEGLVHIGAGSNYTVGDTGGEKTHKLTVNEMPAHTHDLPNIMGYVMSTAGGNGTYGAVNTWTKVASKGGDQAHNNMQPYIVVNRWHRTA